MTVLRYQRLIRAPYLKRKLNLWRRSDDPKLIWLLSPLLLLAGYGMSIGKKTVSILHLGNQAMNSVWAAECNQNVSSSRPKGVIDFDGTNIIWGEKKVNVLSGVELEPTPTRVDCDLNAAP